MDSSLMKLCRQLQSLAKLFRFVEVCIVLVFLSWLSAHLPFAVRISGEYFRKLVSLILCPTSIFLLGNAIVVTLLAKSGLFSGDCSSSIDNAVAELYDEFRSEDDDDIPVLGKEEIVYQDKEIICEENVKKPLVSKLVLEEIKPKAVFSDEIKPKAYFSDEKKPETVFSDEKEVSYRRSQSENMMKRECVENKQEKLRRSETDIYWRSFTGDESTAAATAEELMEDGMSSDEFRRTIEAFIAKQVSFHREERLSVVLHGQA
ncbi:uncharacterized protein LOC110685606 [Chenopodium quinoa]|uniref:DUF4408 domain-containing protein n=1 Tax=Chenopodium quinoa TaxID=63459 RepID=A0A803L6W2_CHEQI|nr:uncharacterized protein LOC110685606 [Chenopodium quinoa]